MRELLGEAFELEFYEGDAPETAESGEALWEFNLAGVGPLKLLYGSLDPEQREEFHRASSRCTSRAARVDEICQPAALPVDDRPPHVVATQTLRDEVMELLQELIRLNTVNPPGNETTPPSCCATTWSRSGSSASSTRACRSGRTSWRGSRGSGDGPRLLFLSHTDTVLADPAEWTVDPWSGELRDGQVWGRGALDMKGQVAASAVAIASLAARGSAAAAT